MDKPTPIPAVVTPLAARRPPLDPSANTAEASSGTERKAAKTQKMPFAYSPGPMSVILLKIMVMENYSANAGRLTRQKQFCSRVKGA